MPGATTLGADVTTVSSHCVWMLIDDEELALPYSEFPWLKAATTQQVFNVLRPGADHPHWPDLEVDLSVESIRHRSCPLRPANGKRCPPWKDSDSGQELHRPVMCKQAF